MQELEKYTIPELLLHIMQRLYDTDKVKNRARFGFLNAYIRQYERAHIQAASAIIMPARFGKYNKTKQEEIKVQEVGSFDELYQKDATQVDGYTTETTPLNGDELPVFVGDNYPLDDPTTTDPTQLSTGKMIGDVFEFSDSPPIESMEDEVVPVPTKRGRKKKCCG